MKDDIADCLVSLRHVRHGVSRMLDCACELAVVFRPGGEPRGAAQRALEGCFEGARGVPEKLPALALLPRVCWRPDPDGCRWTCPLRHGKPHSEHERHPCQDQHGYVQVFGQNGVTHEACRRVRHWQEGIRGGLGLSLCDPQEG